jgi:hypothetical protein
MSVLLLRSIVVISFCLAGCTSERASPPESEAPDEQEQADGLPPAAMDTTQADTISMLPQLTATKQGTIRLEGTEEPITLALYRPPDWFPLPFYTYHPEDIVAGTVTAGEVGQTVRFTANMGGVLNDDAFVELYVLPEGMSEEDARVLVRENAQDIGSTRQADENRFSWSLEEHLFESPEFLGMYALGSHGGRFFQIMIAYPPEYGDGFGPRAQLILNEWHWADTGAAL